MFTVFYILHTLSMTVAQLATEFNLETVDGLVKILLAILFLVTAYFLKQFADTVRKLVEDQQGLAVAVQLIRQDIQTIQTTLQKHESQIDKNTIDIHSLSGKKHREID